MSDPARRFPPQLRTLPERPRDPFAGVRMVLHATALGVWILSFWDIVEWPLWAIIGGACETTAFALRRTDQPPANATEVGVRLGCGAVFGLIAGPSAAFFYGLSLQGMRGVVFAVVGGVICAALAVRFGDRFWWWVS